MRIEDRLRAMSNLLEQQRSEIDLLKRNAHKQSELIVEIGKQIKELKRER